MNKTPFPKKKLCCWSFRHVSTFHKKVFSGAPVKCSSVFGSNNSDSFLFENAAFGEIRDYSLRTTLFQEKKFYGSFEIVSTLCKKVFARTPVKGFSLLGSNYSDYLVFGNAASGEMKDHSLRTIPFQRKICIGSFELVSTLYKKVVLKAPVQCFSLYGSNKIDSAVFRNAAFGEIKDHSLRKKPIKKKEWH